MLRPDHHLSHRSLILVAMLAFTVSACGSVSSPTAPEPVSAGEWVVPDVLTASLALIDSDTRPVPVIGRPAGAWLRETVRGVRIDASLPSHVRAQCCGSDRMIQWSAAWLPNPNNADDVRIAAAILVHEARHAEGFRHTCPDQRRDRSFEEGGAWAVHSAWLRHMGDNHTADSIATSDIGCR